MIDVSDLIGVPYKDHGRSKEEGFDCYGLVLEIAWRMEKPLPDVWYQNHNLELSNENAHLLPIHEVDYITEGVIIEMEVNNELHIGVALNNREMIHATRKGVRINQIGMFPVRQLYTWD